MARQKSPGFSGSCTSDSNSLFTVAGAAPALVNVTSPASLLAPGLATRENRNVCIRAQHTHNRQQACVKLHRKSDASLARTALFTWGLLARATNKKWRKQMLAPLQNIVTIKQPVLLRRLPVPRQLSAKSAKRSDRDPPASSDGDPRDNPCSHCLRRRVAHGSMRHDPLHHS